MNLERLGSLTSELSTHLLKSLVIPQGTLLGWLSRHRADRSREKVRPGRIDTRMTDALDVALARFPEGPVVLLGGSPAPDEAVVSAIHLAGGRSVRMAVVPVAGLADPESTAAAAMRLFTRFGMKKVELVELDSREKATSQEWSDRLAAYDAVVLCGESTAQGLRVLQGTLAGVALRELVEAGKLLVGIDAGAAILGSRCFAGDQGAQLVAGLGILPGLLVETSFSQADRFGRLARAIEADEHQPMLGTGIDAGAALVVHEAEARVLGESSVTFLDPRDRGLRLSGPGGVKVHLLYEGYKMNLRLRRSVAPEQVSSAR